MHPYFGVAFVFFFALQALNWLQPMIWTAADSRWMRNMHKIVSGEAKMDPPDKVEKSKNENRYRDGVCRRQPYSRRRETETHAHCAEGIRDKGPLPHDQLVEVHQLQIVSQLPRAWTITVAIRRGC